MATPVSLLVTGLHVGAPWFALEVPPGSKKTFFPAGAGSFEKFFRLTHLLPLTGEEFAGKVTENCAPIIKSAWVYGDAEAKAIDKFIEIYKGKNLHVGFFNHFFQSPTGTLAIAFSKDGSIIPEERGVVIENKPLSEALLDSIIGKNGVSPALKRSLVERLSQILYRSVTIKPRWV